MLKDSLVHEIDASLEKVSKITIAGFHVIHTWERSS